MRLPQLLILLAEPLEEGTPSLGRGLRRLLYFLLHRLLRRVHLLHVLLEHPPLRSHLARQPLLRGLPLHASLLKRLFLAALGLGESVVAQLLRAHGLQPLLRQRGV